MKADHLQSQPVWNEQLGGMLLTVRDRLPGDVKEGEPVVGLRLEATQAFEHYTLTGFVRSTRSAEGEQAGELYVEKHSITSMGRGYGACGLDTDTLNRMQCRIVRYTVVGGWENPRGVSLDPSVHEDFPPGRLFYALRSALRVLNYPDETHGRPLLERFPLNIHRLQHPSLQEAARIALAAG